MPGLHDVRARMTRLEKLGPAASSHDDRPLKQ
jgi:hypothetical protein